MRSTVFDYRALRLVVGIIAFALPFVVSTVAVAPLASISASYYTEARDLFVGLLFFVSAFLCAYKGHSTKEAAASRLAAASASLVALFPTTCVTCETDAAATVHYVAAAALFSILAYFCFGPFRQKLRNRGAKPQRRSRIYLICGIAIVACMLGLAAAKLTLTDDTIAHLQLTYWAEAGALVAFGVAWLVAGKWIPFLVDEDERLHLLEKRQSAT